MKAEPLKGKLMYSTYHGNIKVASELEIKSSVEWLKTEIKKTIKLRQDVEDAFYKNCDLSGADSYQKQREDLEWCIKMIDKAFEDVMKDEKI